MKRVIATLLMVVAVAQMAGCGVVKDDFAWVDARHADYYRQRGFEPQGYQGYNMATIGRCYWCTLKKGDVIYQSCLLKWGDELHEYSLQAIDALKGTSR
jgi:hypothetical protein